MKKPYYLKTNDQPIQISEDTYYVGTQSKTSKLHCNAYLIIDQEEAILIDPGSVLNFYRVLTNIKQLISLSQIKYIILSHEDPDLASSLPLFEKHGVRAKLVCDWKASQILVFYGVKSPHYIINENQYLLTLTSGRKIQFISAPFLHAAGAILTYDLKSKFLFTGDLFGGYSVNWELYANSDYLEAMKVYHENYMPSHEFIRPVMNLLLKKEIEMILPQHGSIIKEHIIDYINELKDLEFYNGELIITKRIKNRKINYTTLCNKVLYRLKTLYDKKEIFSIFDDSQIILDLNSLEIIEHKYSGYKLWNKIFELIYYHKGVNWLIMIESFVIRLCNQYRVKKPLIYKSKLVTTLSQIDLLDQKNKELRDMINRLNENLEKTSDKLLRDPKTNYYNETFLHQYVEADLVQLLESTDGESSALLFIDIDNLLEINLKYGNDVGDETIRNLGYALEQLRESNHLIFKRSGPGFVYYMTETQAKDAKAFAEMIRNTMPNQDVFIEDITVSIAIAHLNEVSQKVGPVKEMVEHLFTLADVRINLAKNLGKNQIIDQSSRDLTFSLGKILLVDEDESSYLYLKYIFKQINFELDYAPNGLMAYDKICQNRYDIILSEAVLPKWDGFTLKEKLNESIETKDIPFIFISHKKSEELILRANKLNILYYLKKPFFKAELFGIVKHLKERRFR